MRIEEAVALFDRVPSESEVADRHQDSIHREWVALARREAGH